MKVLLLVCFAFLLHAGPSKCQSKQSPAAANTTNNTMLPTTREQPKEQSDETKSSLEEEWKKAKKGFQGKCEGNCKNKLTALIQLTSKDKICTEWVKTAPCIKNDCDKNKPTKSALSAMKKYCGGCASTQATVTVVGILLAIVTFLNKYL
ncbi:hypothetical protein PoB_005553400 [Plakobranchus ocellatus]|uniref:Uncharacterized protein n=1 Tax=Plakobranchus ocellatus TaxID=259542 RepID=A0AAV4C8Y5_9GAST|nr:hypothetical protein PoB_005553400 [Plakobranchus ocellatus]